VLSDTHRITITLLEVGVSDAEIDSNIDLVKRIAATVRVGDVESSTNRP
jgi:hypothetical protein